MGIMNNTTIYAAWWPLPVALPQSFLSWDHISMAHMRIWRPWLKAMDTQSSAGWRELDLVIGYRRGGTGEGLLADVPNSINKISCEVWLMQLFSICST